MPREGVPYPGGAICRLKCELKNLWQAVGMKLHSINGVPGDGAGNVKILAGQNVQIVNDQVHNEITISATDAVGTVLRKASVTLTAAGWNNNSQTVSVAGLAADEDVLVAADPSNYDDWNTAGIRAVSQAAESITFDCDTAPVTDLTANLVIGRLNV